MYSLSSLIQIKFYLVNEVVKFHWCETLKFTELFVVILSVDPKTIVECDNIIIPIFQMEKLMFRSLGNSSQITQLGRGGSKIRNLILGWMSRSLPLVTDPFRIQNSQRKHYLWNFSLQYLCSPEAAIHYLTFISLFSQMSWHFIFFKKIF